MKKASAKVLIVMGSDSDLPVMAEAARILEENGIPCEMTVASAHRTPQRAARLASGAEKRGLQVIIAGAGMAAHLAGVLAAHTILPVIGIPVDASPLNGMDALLATVQMPPGVPVAAVAVGKAGARNAAVLAMQIIARADDRVAERLHRMKKELAEQVTKAARRVARTREAR